MLRLRYHWCPRKQYAAWKGICTSSNNSKSCQEFVILGITRFLSVYFFVVHALPVAAMSHGMPRHLDPIPLNPINSLPFATPRPSTLVLMHDVQISEGASSSSGLVGPAGQSHSTKSSSDADDGHPVALGTVMDEGDARIEAPDQMIAVGTPLTVEDEAFPQEAGEACDRESQPGDDSNTGNVDDDGNNDADEDDEDRTHVEEPAPDDDQGCWPKFRWRLRCVCNSKVFQGVILFLILANSVSLAFDTPQTSDAIKDVLDIIELVFLILFTIEMLLKMVAFGLFRNVAVDGTNPPQFYYHGYFRNAWNWLDFGIVVIGWVTEFQSDGASLSGLRAMRVFRVLKGVSQVGGMRVLVESLAKAAPALANVMVLLLFFLVMFSIVGVQLFSGVLNRRCYLPTVVDNVTYYTLDAEAESRCDLDGSPVIFTGWPCYGGTLCWEPSTFPAGMCFNGTDCVYTEPVLSWDNIFRALLISMKIVSLDDWPTDQEHVQDAVANVAWCFFWCLTILGSLYAINLVLAVQSEEFSKSAEHMRQRNNRRGARQNDTRIHRALNRFDRWRRGSSRRGRFREKVLHLVQRRSFQFFMLVTIALNAVILACDYYQAPQALKDTIQYVNLTCTIIFIIEFVLKLVGLGMRGYFSDKANWFDFVLVTASVVELFFSDSSALSAFRAFRLARVLQLARKWHRLKKMVGVLGAAFGDAMYLFCLLTIFLFIFTILGMQLYGNQGVSSEDPRFSFETLWESFYTVFIVITGESWATMMAITMEQTSWVSCFYFLALFVLGNYLIINLFICILVDSLAHYSELQRQKELQNGKPPSMWKQSMRRITTFRDARRQSRRGTKQDLGTPMDKDKAHDANTNGPSNTGISDGNGDGDHDNSVEKGLELELSASVTESVEEAARKECSVAGTSTACGATSTSANAMQNPLADLGHQPAPAEDPSPGNMTQLKFLEDSPVKIYQKKRIGRPDKSASCQQKVGWVVNHPWFCNTVVVLIVANALFLCFDTPWTDGDCLSTECDTWSLVQYISNLFFVIVFTIELVLNLIAYGPKEFCLGAGSCKFEMLPWANWLDIFIVLTSIIGLFVVELRVFRAFRTVRLVTRVERLKVVVRALCSAIPVLGTVCIVLGFIWFLFGVLGVQLMMGRYWACIDEATGEPTTLNEDQCTEPGFSWERPRWDFDNILTAFVTLTIVAFGEGWAAIMWQAIDSTPPGLAPDKNNSPFLGIYFVAFVMFGSFLALNLFVGTLIDSFLDSTNTMSVLTDEQRNFVKSMRVLLKAKLPPAHKKPAPGCRRRVYTLVTNVYFDLTITFLIVLNIIFMAMEYYDQPQYWSDMLAIANYVFVSIFACEALLKIVALGHKMYFLDNWNRFDFAVVIISLIAIPFDGPGTSVFRMLRVLRIFRLIKRFKSLQLCFTTLVLALPSLINVVMIMLLVMFIFGVMGVRLFGRIQVEGNPGLTHNLNFSNLYYALILLYTISTTETWPDVMEGCQVDGPDCEATDACGTWVAVPYFLVYMVLAACIILNAIIMVVIAHFDTSHDPGKSIFTDLKTKWSCLDPSGTKLMNVSLFFILIRTLDRPIGTAVAVTRKRRLSTKKSIRRIAGQKGTPRARGRQASVLGGDFVACLRALTDLHVPLTRDFQVQYDQVVLAICLKIYGCDETMLETLARHMEVADVPQLDKMSFAVHHLWAVRCVERFWSNCARNSRRGAARRRRSQGASMQAVSRTSYYPEADGAALHLPKFLGKSISTFSLGSASEGPPGPQSTTDEAGFVVPTPTHSTTPALIVPGNTPPRAPAPSLISLHASQALGSLVGQGQSSQSVTKPITPPEKVHWI